MKSPTSWCQYQRDQCNGTNLFKHGPGLHKDVIAAVKPIYKDLIKHEELAKCLHGKTHNQNESFNALIWERAPKGVYRSLPKINFAVYDAVSVFNDGRRGSLKVLEGVGREAINTHRTDVTENCGKLTKCQQFAHTEPMSPRIAENQRMSTPSKKFVKLMIILGCNWLTVSKIKKKQRESLVSLVCYGWKGRR